MSTNNTADGDGIFPERIPTDEELLATGLAAVRSLLHERRRGRRRELLIDSVVSFVAQHGRHRESYVREGVRRLWGTTTLPDALFDRAFQEAEAAGLICRPLDLEGRSLIEPTTTATEEAKADRAWVDQIVRAFTEETRIRLIGYEHEADLVRRCNDVATSVVRALAHGVTGAIEVEYAGETLLRPVSIDPASIRQFADQLDPHSWRKPVLELAEAALDPADDYGNEIVHLLVVGNVLHSLVAQRALPARPALDTTVLLLDASVLIPLTADPEDPERRLITDLIRSSVALGVRVCVAHHTQAEWRGLWMGADHEVGGHTDGKDLDLPVAVLPMIRSPFVRQYVEYLHQGGRSKWSQWSSERRNLPRLMDGLGVEFLSRMPLDGSRFEPTLQERNKKRSTHRETAAIACDAKTCSLIESWRNDGLIAYFVTSDTMSPAAYRDVTDDPVPLAVDPRTWVIYTTNLLTDDPDQAIAIAELVTQVSVRNSLFSLASGFRLGDVIEFVGILKGENSTVTSEEVRDIVSIQLTVFDTLEELAEEATRDPAVRGAELARQIASRRIGRAEVERRRMEERERVHSREIAQERARTAAAKEEAAGVLGKLVEHRIASQRFRRKTAVAGVTAGFAAFIAGMGMAGLVGPLGLAIGFLVALWWLFTGLSWAKQVERDVGDLGRETMAALALEVAIVLLSVAIG